MDRRPRSNYSTAAGLHANPAAATGAFATRVCGHSVHRAFLPLCRAGASLVGLLLVSHCTNGGASHSPEHADLVAALARVKAARTIEPRLSIPTAYRSCPAAVPVGGTVPRAQCALTPEDLAPSSATLDLAQRASARIRAEADPEALHAAALIDLLWADEGGIPLERSISYLRTASRLANRSAGVLTDLAAALLVRAGRYQTPRDLLEAIEMTDRALDLEPRNEAARFNLALGLERLGLDGQAHRAWKAVLEVDSTSRWAEEARRRPRTPPEGPGPLEPPPAGGSPSEISAYVESAPEAAMLFGWDHALDGWSAAVIAGDTNCAGSYLRLAATIGDQLEQRGRDATLADGVRAIRAVAGRPPVALALARAHHEYAVGRAAYRAGDNAAAERSFERVLATPVASAPLVAWARLRRAAVLVLRGRPEAAEAASRQVIAYADTLRHSSLAARARGLLGTTLLRHGLYEQAIRATQGAAPLFERSGERENLGSVQGLAADAGRYLGDPSKEYTSIHRALNTLRPYRRSVSLHNLLSTVAGPFAAGDGLSRAGVRLQDEDLEIAEGIGDPIYLAEARLARARLLATAGLGRRAAEDVTAARPLVEALKPGPREWFEADLRLAQAVTSLTREPARAIAALDSVVAFFDSQHNQIRLLPALVARSEAALALDNGAAATADLDRALGILHEQSASTTSIDLRASLLDAARHVVDRLVMLRVASGLPGEALADLEKARVALTPVSPRFSTEPPSHPVGPTGEVVAEYALVGDTLLIWTIAETRVQLARATVDRVRLVRTIERARAALELRADEPGTLRDLAALYDWLIRPVEPRLGATGAPLVLIADGEIASIPFAALRDTARRQYLVEVHPLRVASSLRDAGQKAQRSKAAGMRVLLVADPAFDPRAFPGLQRLPGAGSEVEEIAAQYADTIVLAGPGASRSALEAALHTVDIVHYAGHAVFDDNRPEQSLLVLAHSSRDPGSDRLTAADVERLDLTHVRLVVLSACETIPSRSGPSGGFAGLAGAFMAAGAGGVVGSLWRVDDRLTQELMSEFHRAYRQSGDGADALRAAQLRLLRSAEPALRSAAAWAAFRYAGT
jgi:CHAT domain-containing protein/tetratricopeptide (TPR) repeat protein